MGWVGVGPNLAGFKMIMSNRESHDQSFGVGMVSQKQALATHMVLYQVLNERDLS